MPELKIPISWNPYTGGARCRNVVDPNARDPNKPVTLAWLRKHAPDREYLVEWWEGPDENEGEWLRKYWAEGSTKLRDVKAFMLAGTVTVFEVEVKLVSGRDLALVVWEFGHYKRETTAAKAARGETR
jgi:hypothetical protein